MKLRTRSVLFLAVVACAAASSISNAQTPTKKAKVRVMFVEPKNGATVTSPVHLKFGSQGIEIAPVPAGDVKTARPGMAHYHVGIDQPCLPAGKTIVKGTP